MEILRSITEFMSNFFFSQPAFLIGLIALVGLLVQKKPVQTVISGSIKTAVGFLIMSLGVNLIVGAVDGLGPLMSHIFGIPAVQVTAASGAFIENYGAVFTIIMTLGFLVNIFLARVTRFKYIYLTGHIMFWTVMVFCAVLVEVFPGISNGALIIIGSLVMGAYWTLSPALVAKYSYEVTGDDQFVLGHTAAIGAWVSGFLAKFIGDPDDSAEKIQVSESFSFIKDITVATGLIMTVAYLLLVLVAGPAWVQENVSGGESSILYALLKGFSFSVALTVLISGVRMMIAEIVPAFRGISMKIVPDAKPALDCPVFFNYAPTSLILGFLISFSTATVLGLILGVAGIAAVVPPVTAAFFEGGTMAVFANARGGRRAVIVVSILAGIWIVVGQAVCLPLFTDTVADIYTWWNSPDIITFPPILHAILSIFS